MKYLILVSHGTFAPGLHSVLNMLMGPRNDVLSYSMEDGTGADAFVDGLKQVLAPITAHDEVILLGDIIGGSPLTNTLNILTEKGVLSNTTAFSGANLPMAIAALMAIDDGLEGDALVQALLNEGRDGVNQILLKLDEEEEEEEDL
ncbi:PTS fructose transporter subunit IIA [Lancefieldella sp. Marseille-Q7238]|uniref:PTS sugar transporter subunit IIA n=1 Tax=Lancefieldella sp. Marseille-Q7238 TaxID=3022127 RepID=UPI0024A7CD1F|nr:PTS fructose transporter subunit IIA [Lancefieldella sp. Marseille-Q7238]